MWHRTAKGVLLVVAVLWGAVLAAALAPAAAHASLPDGRGYELVSPPDKLGNDVSSDSSRTRAAAAEAPGLPMALAFSSLGGFADVQGMGISTEYLAQRTGQPGTSGWSTHAITPPQAPLSILAAAQVLDPLYEGDMSADLTHAIFRAWSPLTADADVRDVANLYLRENLRQSGSGAWELLTGAAAPLAPISDSTQRPFLAGASSDLRHAIFESRLALTPDAAPGNPMLYRVDDGVVRLLAPAGGCPVGAVPSAPCSIAGAGASALRRTERAISDDGSRVEVSSPVSAATSSISTSPAAPTALYQYDDRGTPDPADDTVTQVNASEKTPPDPPQAARFETASRDGERVFFTSGEQLTNAPGSGLYLWRRTPPPGAGHLTPIGGGVPGTAVVGASGDGRSVYFVAPGQLVPGGPAVAEAGLYLWRDDGSPSGALSFVGGISFADATANDNTSFTWNSTPLVARVTPDGGELLFEVSDGGGLAPHADHGVCTGKNPNNSSDGRCSELYLYRAAGSTPLAPDVVCVSCLPAGAPATASAYVNVHEGAGAAQVTWHLSRALSDDGRRVFFSTAQALVPADVDGRVDAYEYDVGSGTVHLLSSGSDDADSWFLDASASGDDAFFSTRQRLVGWDVDSAYDVYDARVGGGFPDPAPPPAGCTGDACHGVPAAPPPVAALASPAFAGDGNWPAPAARRAARCKRGTVLRRVHGKRRCVNASIRRRRRRPARRRRR
ncbi:MAG TPA: hypothetical protein VFU94_02160 [Conexibacter sp.]|nr:hypothetical protein [Conexibacter sp.]